MIIGQSVDQILEKAIAEIILSRFAPQPRGEATKEIIGQSYLLQNPRARICTSFYRNINLMQLVGRFFWEVAGNDSLEDISYYDSNAIRFAKGDRIPSAYGRRILKYGKSSIDQFARAEQLLRLDRDTRRASLQILTPVDNPATKLEYPCAISYNFLIREEKLNTIVFMRSQSMWGLFPIDVFLVTMLQEIMASDLGIDVGVTQFMCASAHIYPRDLAVIQQVLENGMMSVPYEMAPLFTSNSPSIQSLVDCEIAIRKGNPIPISSNTIIGNRKDEWAQLLNLLIVYKNVMEKEFGIMKMASWQMLKPIYQMMCKRVIPSNLLEGEIHVTIPAKLPRKKGNNNSVTKLEKQPSKKSKKKTKRVHTEATPEQEESKPVEGDSKPSGWL